MLRIIAKCNVFEVTEIVSKKNSVRFLLGIRNHFQYHQYAFGNNAYNETNYPDPGNLKVEIIPV